MSLPACAAPPRARKAVALEARALLSSKKKTRYTHMQEEGEARKRGNQRHEQVRVASSGLGKKAEKVSLERAHTHFSSYAMVPHARAQC